MRGIRGENPSKMPASLKERSSRLQMFARLKSETDVKPKENNDTAPNGITSANAVAQSIREPERYQSSAPALTSAAERRELADSARVPVPGLNGNARQPTGHQRRFSQPPPESVQRSHSQSPASQHRHMDIFTGSQLGDSFMNSGLTTPLYEPSEADHEPIPDRKNATVPAPAPAPPVAGPAPAISRPVPRYNNFDKRFLTSDNATFQLGEDLLMRVVPGTRNHNPTYMNDGFNRAVVNGYNKPVGHYRTTYARPEQLPEKQPNLPVREVKIRHMPKPRQMEFDHGQKRSASPVFASRGRPMRGREDDLRPLSRFRGLEEVEEDDRGEGGFDEEENGDMDDGTSTVGGHQDGHATPRIRRHPMSPRRVLESAIATTMQPFRPSAPKGNKRRRESLDYDDMALSTMSYNELQNEPFDFDPSKAPTHVGSGGAAGSADTLTAKLEQYQHQSEKEQRALFRSMNVDDWEEAGDWFADQFHDLMHKLREARRNKRRMIQEFENEAADREAAVRLRTEAIERKLAKMKQDGQRVVTPNEAAGSGR
ncbi:extracellular mutant protein 11 domain-containing protein [Trichoderma longibrachiatum]